jgi:hypothetical protein
MSKRFLRRWGAGHFSLAPAMLFLLFSMGGIAVSQTETGQISGKVTDQNGAVIPNATVTAKNANTNVERTVQSNDAGEYIITNLQPGRYDVTASGGSFQPTKVTVELTVGAKTTADIKLGIPQIAGEVNVVAAGGVEVNTTSQEISNVVSGTQIRELPTITRDPYALAVIASNVSDVNGNDAQGGVTSRGVGVAINGQRAASTNILLDGGENVDTFTATVGQRIPLDSVSEFRIITSNFSAEYGRAGGGIVNVATLAGTNSFHGTGYEFNRISRFASNGFNNNANGLPKGHFTRNQFGYSIGGPVKKNKLFFFSSTEWTRVRSNSSQINSVIAPEFLALAGVSAQTKAVISSYSLASNAAVGEVTQTAAQLKARFGVVAGDPFFSIPDSTPVFRAVRFSVPADVGAGSPQNSYDTVARIDWNRSSRTQLYGRFAYESLNFFDGSISSSPWAGFNSGETDRNQNWLISLTHNFSPKLVSQSKLVYNRLNDLQPLAAAPVGPTFFLTNTAFQQIGGHSVAFPGYLPYTPGNGIPFGGPQNLGQAYEDLSWTRGKHTFRFGGQYVYIQDNRSFGAYEEATEAIGSNVRGALNNLVTGNVFQFQVAVFPQGKFPGGTLTLPVGPPAFSRSNRYNDWALYFNDSWRVRSNFTLNLGMRYEYYGVQHNKNPNLDSNFYFGGDGTVSFANIRSGSVQITPNSPIGGLWKPDKNNFAPRLGFAWDIKGDGKMSIRGGYGRAFERNFGNVTFNVIQNPPNYAVVSITAPADFASIPISNSNFGPLAGNVGTKVLPISSLRAVDPNIVNAYADFWSLSFERELGRGTVFSMEYSGSAGRKLYDIANINRLGTGTTYLGSTVTRPDTGGQTSRLNGQYSNINFRGQHGESDYEGVSFNLESSRLGAGNRLTHLFKGMQFTARYTLSHAKDNLSSTFSESTNNGSFILGYLDPFNPKLDYADADFDVRHRFVGSFNWDLPLGEKIHGVARQVLGGWALTGIVVARSGTPFSVYDCSFAITICMRMLAVAPGLRFTGPSTPAPSGDPNRFNFIDLRPQFPGAGSFTDASGAAEVGPYPLTMTGRNAFRSPGFWNMDFGLYKSFKITERTRIQLRSEFFNIFNHANLFVSGSDADIAEVDQVQAFRDGRRHIQFAAKIIF